MDQLPRIVFFTTCMITAAISQCENRASVDYEYFICNVTLVFDASREYCNKTHGADLVTYPTEAEYNFTRDMLRNYTAEKGLPYYDHFLGVYQTRGSSVLVAYSGKFYWVDNEQDEITSNSSTYWQPISQWIVNFQSLTTGFKSQRTFTMRDGVQQSGDVFNTGFPTNALVLCQRKVNDITTSTITIPQTTTMVESTTTNSTPSTSSSNSTTPTGSPPSSSTCGALCIVLSTVAVIVITVLIILGILRTVIFA